MMTVARNLSLLLALLLAASSTSASESMVGWFPVSAQVNIAPFQADVTIWNPSGYPVACRGQLAAQTYYRGPGYINFALGLVGPGTYGYAYLNPPFGDHFVGGYATVYCRYL